MSRWLRIGGGVPLEKFPGGSSYRRLSGALHSARKSGLASLSFLRSRGLRLERLVLWHIIRD